MWDCSLPLPIWSMGSGLAIQHWLAKSYFLCLPVRQEGRANCYILPRLADDAVDPRCWVSVRGLVQSIDADPLDRFFG